MAKHVKSKTSMESIHETGDRSDRARFVFWKHLQLFKYVWVSGIGFPQTRAYSGLQWIQIHERFGTEHHVHDPLLRRVLAEFIQHVSDTGGPGAALEDILTKWDAKFDAISMTDDEIQNFTGRCIFARPELFNGITNDIVPNREVLRRIAAEKMPAFLEHAYSLPSPSAMKEYFVASQ